MRIEANVSGNERIQRALRELAETINPQMKERLMGERTAELLTLRSDLA